MPCLLSFYDIIIVCSHFGLGRLCILVKQKSFCEFCAMFHTAPDEKKVNEANTKKPAKNFKKVQKILKKLLTNAAK